MSQGRLISASFPGEVLLFPENLWWRRDDVIWVCSLQMTTDKKLEIGFICYNCQQEPKCMIEGLPRKDRVKSDQETQIQRGSDKKV